MARADLLWARMCQRQGEWADHAGIRVDASGYTLSIEDNLFQPLSPASRREFEAGSGAELGEGGARGKMQALHSSSALAVNVFDYWRGRDAAPIAVAMNLPGSLTDLRFEEQFPTGLRGTPPNLDVTMRSGDSIIAVESKFLEPYGSRKHASPFKSKYFPADRELWNERGLPRCQRLAKGLQDGRISWHYLNASQLLKHALGLASQSKPFTLFYLWFAPDSEEARIQGDEVTAFADAVTPELPFRAKTYQVLFADLAPHLTSSHRAYADYLNARYFAVGPPMTR